MNVSAVQRERWYVVGKDAIATECANEREAVQAARDFESELPAGAPYIVTRQVLAAPGAGAAGQGEVPTIDLDRVFLDACHAAVKANSWMPAEYMANDWQADVLDLLRNGPGTFTTPPAASLEVSEAAVLAACNAYDQAAETDGESPREIAQYPWMHAALTAAIDSAGGAKGEDDAARDVPVWTLIDMAERCGAVADEGDDCKFWTIDLNGMFALEAALRSANIDVGFANAAFCNSKNTPQPDGGDGAVAAECQEFVTMVGDEFGNEAGVRLRSLFQRICNPIASATAPVGYLAENGREAYLLFANDSESLDAYTADGFNITPLTRPSAAAVPETPDVALLASMACCLNHGFGLENVTSQNRQLADMRKLWDEVTGRGYYSPANRSRYIEMLAQPRAEQGEGSSP